MPRQYWAAPYTPLAISDGPAVTAAALTDASPIPQRQVPVTSFEPGTMFKMHAQGDVTCTGTTPTLVLGFYWGTIGSIATATPIAVGPALTLPGIPTAWPWEMDWEGEVRGLGSSGSVEGQGTIKFTGNGLAAAMSVFPMPITAAGRLVTVNLLNQQFLMVGATWNVTTGTPSLTCHHASAEFI